MVNVTNSTNVNVGFIPLKGLFCHCYRFLVVFYQLLFLYYEAGSIATIQLLLRRTLHTFCDSAISTTCHSSYSMMSR